MVLYNQKQGLMMRKESQDKIQEHLVHKCPKCSKIIEFNQAHHDMRCEHCGYYPIDPSISDISSMVFDSQPHQEQILTHFHNLGGVKKTFSMDPQYQRQQKSPTYYPNNMHSLSLPSAIEDQSSSDEEEERLKIQEKELKQIIRHQNHTIKAEKKVIVGSGFTFDITEFFKFKKKELGAEGQPQTFFEEISGSRIAWLILLYTICSTALIPGWIMNIKATKLLRQCWRFLMQALVVLPFVFHQKRTLTQENKQKYTLSYIFDPHNIIKPYISSLSASLWFLFALTSFEWTYVSHGIVLGGLSNFFLSINRSINKNSHDLESGGQLLVIFGVILVIHDSLSVETREIPLHVNDYLNTFFMRRTWWERLGGDLIAIFTSLMMSQFSKYTSDLRNYYPPFLCMLIVNIFNVLNLTLISFFFNGATFDMDSYWGIFSVFTDTHFISFMYMAIVLAFGQLISVYLIIKMFPDPIIPALAMTLQPFLACFFIDLTKIQILPGNFAMIGFILILPGMLIILMGQCFFQRQKSFKEQSNKKVQHLLDEIKQLKAKTHQRQTHVEMRRQRLLNTTHINTLLNRSHTNVNC